MAGPTNTMSTSPGGATAGSTNCRRRCCWPNCRSSTRTMPGAAGSPPATVPPWRGCRCAVRRRRGRISWPTCTCCAPRSVTHWRSICKRKRSASGCITRWRTTFSAPTPGRGLRGPGAGAAESLRPGPVPALLPRPVRRGCGPGQRRSPLFLCPGLKMLSLLIPVYRNETGLPDLLAAVQSLHARLEGAMETVFVVDGSPDRCYEILRERLPHCALRARLVLLSRNFGSFAAIRVALQRASGAYFAVLAADLQEPPELVLRMHAALSRADCDVVIGVRQTRHEPLTTRLPAQIFWWLYRRYVLSEIPPGGVDVFACNRAFRDSLLQLQERHSSLIAQMFWLGFRRQQLSSVRQTPQHGVSAWTLRKKNGYMADSIFSFTHLPIPSLLLPPPPPPPPAPTAAPSPAPPIRWRLRAGLGGTLAATVVGAAVLAAKLLGAITVPGYAMIMLTIVFFGALNLLSLGVVGSYAWRAYENTKARPLAVVLRDEQFGPPGVSNPGE